MPFSVSARALPRCLAVLAIATTLLVAPRQAQAAGNKAITDAGDVLRFAVPAAAAGISLYKDDYQGLAQLAVAWTATVGIAYALKHVVHERRPNGVNYQSFPSDSAASAQAGAAYLWHRYGWQYGVPAFGMAVFVGYSRVQAKEHHWYDVAASDVITLAVNYFVVTRYHPPSNAYRVSFGASPNGVSVHLAMNF